MLTIITAIIIFSLWISALVWLYKQEGKLLNKIHENRKITIDLRTKYRNMK